MNALGFHHHRRVHNANRRDVQDRRLAFEFRVQQFRPRRNRPLDQIRTNAQRVGVVDRRNQRHELGWRGGELLRLFTFKIDHLFGCGALIADLFPGDFALSEERGDFVGVLDALGVDALEVAGRHDLLEREELGVDQVKAVGRGDGALGHVVGGHGDVLNFDAGVGFEFLGNRLVLVHGRAEVAQHNLFLRVNERRNACSQDAGQACAALEQRATLLAVERRVGRINHESVSSGWL